MARADFASRAACAPCASRAACAPDAAPDLALDPASDSTFDSTPARRAPLVRFVTMGCAKNEVDTDKMRANLRAYGYRVDEETAPIGEGGLCAERALAGAQSPKAAYGYRVDEETAPVGEGGLDADVVIINTCSFIAEATQESIDMIFAALDEQEERAARGGQAKVVVAGCMPSRYGDDLAAEIPEVDAFVPLAEEQRIAEVVARLVGPAPRRASGFSADGDAAWTEERTAPGPSAYLKISDGCSRRCAYCAIPLIRGPYASRSASSVVEEADRLVALGAREIVLIGQDTGIWGSDFSDDRRLWAPLERPSLAALVSHLAKRHPTTWIRVMYLQPQGISDELLAAMAALPNVCNYLDVPLQHCDPRVLKEMNRSGSADEYLQLIAHIRDIMGEETALRTTFIAGFPSETDEEASALVGFAEQAGFEFGGVFPYSPEDGTPAARRDDQVPDDVKARRTQTLRDTMEAAADACAVRRIGKVYDVLVCGVVADDEPLPTGASSGDDSPDEATSPVFWGRTMFQAPDVDGVTTFRGGRQRQADPQEQGRRRGQNDIAAGDIVSVRIVASMGCDLEGELA